MHPLAPSALVVEPDSAKRLRIVSTLTSAGFQVTATDTFEIARRRIVDSPPSVLITALKLSEYNGLHLVLRARAAAPRTATLVTSDEAGRAFQKDAQQTGATLVMEPIDDQQLLAAVLRTMFRHDESVFVEPPFERRVSDRRLTSGGHSPNRRLRERRRDLETLLQFASLS
jgi:DNA-binding response OmpR family regulator